jgi:hypothetical protein
MNDLDNLAIKYGTDRLGKHHYTQLYYDMFKDCRDNVKKVLEIGVSEGAGLRMWQDFFPNAKIYGAEIKDEYVFNEGRMEVFKCDAASPSELKSLLDKTGTDIDLVIDDASHRTKHQLITCGSIVPKLQGNFTYVIEDVAWDWIFEDIKKMLPDCECVMTRVGKRFDDRIIIIKRRS